MKNAKRLISMTLGLSLLLPLAACSGAGVGDPHDTTNGPQDSAAVTHDTENAGNATGGSDKTEPPETTAEPLHRDPPRNDAEALVWELSSGIYKTSTQTTAEVGLADPQNVGIDEASFTATADTVPPDGECAAVFYVTDHGITTKRSDNSAVMAGLISKVAKVEGIKKIVFPEGVYRFARTTVFSGISDLYVCGEDGRPFTILMTSWQPGIKVTDCQNIHFNGYRFDYEHPSAVTGRVVSSDSRSRTVTLKIDEPYDLSRPEYNGGRVQYGSYMEYEYDAVAGVYVPNYNGNLLYNSTGDGIRNIKDGSYDPATRELTITFGCQIKDVAAGVRVNVAFTMYEHFGFHASDSRGLYIEDVCLYHTAGMAMGASRVEGIYINRLRIAPPEGSERLMTATADCLHFGSCTGEIVVKNSYFSHSHDDAMNIKGAYAKVLYGLPQSIVYDKSYGTLEAKVGDVLDAYEVATFKYLGSWTITGIDTEDGRYTVAEPVGVELKGALICNASTSPALTVDNCFIGDKRNRGMLIQCRGAVVSNCTFRNVLHGAIQILSVADIFAEGIMPRDVTVKNNKFLQNTVTDVNVFTWGPSGTAPGTIRGINILNNFFYGSASCAVHMLGAGDSTVSGNLFADVAATVQLEQSQDITVVGNRSFSGDTAECREIVG